MERLREETEKKQRKLEAEALAKYEAEQADEEKKRAAEEAKGGKPAAKGKAPAQKGKGGKGDGGPELDVEQLECPEPTPFKSQMENEYIRERPLAEIIDKLMTPIEEEEIKPDGEVLLGDADPPGSSANITPAEDPKSGKASALSNKTKPNQSQDSKLKDKRESVNVTDSNPGNDG